MLKKLTALLLILVIVAIAACTAPIEETKTGRSTTTEVSEEVVVGEDIDEITSIEDDLDTSALDSLDQDLADITW